ncbi:MAG: DUF2007 domain-containing protein [Dehalococcoidales bacterium]|nr:DUF2007 domain-containing protein [Dehalococcoidales bacterium]MDD3264513.1 DUF2007 domain-containing protein [Dehalococcoidales bacterium]MDD4322188.1 DUF2007 domain-containing protein [Dehalococcoidales bacterium]MDD4794195.1 DUF2007 domain-containing protein [Dehalococcoidales bacterium]MDD5121863.1 DUF2007 domain-containing protein [Dehalococcoidales bacterium]
MNNSHKLIKVYQASGELEALTIKSMLESFGVPSLLRSNAAGSVHPFSVDGMGMVEVMVNEQDAEYAHQLISDRNEDV